MPVIKFRHLDLSKALFNGRRRTPEVVVCRRQGTGGPNRPITMLLWVVKRSADISLVSFLGDVGMVRTGLLGSGQDREGPLAVEGKLL